ncbi:MAG: acyl-CoA dehydrogenase [Proteobacteria bacterium]|nr:acyl-CoA dehydrogenase [Pseudomonadota bacterium]
MFYSLLTVAVIFLLLVKRASIAVWIISYIFFVLLVERFSHPNIYSQLMLVLGFIPLLIGVIKPLRQRLLSKPILNVVKKAIPAMSSTEREALEAGTVSFEGELFNGSPNFNNLLNEPAIGLREDEKAFLEGPVNELCRMIDDWDITHVRTDMPEEMWQFLKEKGFFAMIIPKEYGGLEFSATAQFQVLARLYGRSITVGSTVAVPNSLGPGELLLKYGTEEQKNYYLPRLADGREIPCFALTGPTAGSDAASIPDTGIVCRQEFNGEIIVGVRLNWNKRYITLCPKATVVGLAFRMLDPNNLLGKGTNVGISCALIPATTPGVIKGRRHFPLNTAFLNGPTQGKDVFVPMDYLIGGLDMAGHGWRMLMECLSAGRAISLPSSAAGGTQACALATGAYARVRKQFNIAIAHFEGIQQPLARIAANTYLIDSGLRMTAAAIDRGAKPAIAGAILKYQTTERARLASLDAMDIHGGKGICLGPKNYLGRGYQGAPIGITVEGANILTRNLIIFGQGAIRCHPYIFKEMEAARENNLQKFDEAFWSHSAFILSNTLKNLIFNFTQCYLVPMPKSKAKRYYRRIYRYSTQLAFLADFSMGLLGGELKRKEMLSARLGDVLGCLYLAAAVLKRFHDEHEPEADLPLVEWACQSLLHECEEAIIGLINNFPNLFAKAFLKVFLLPWGRLSHQPKDALSQKLANILTIPSETRERIAPYLFKEDIENCPIGQLETVFLQVIEAAPVEKKIMQAVKSGLIHSLSLNEQVEEAKAQGILDDKEVELMLRAEKGRQAVIAVDDFADSELRRISVIDQKKLSDVN